LQQSPIKPRDAFVYFDDSRCRGADLKLSPSAVALITVGVKMCKDKLMQAAGRMRALGKGQRVQLLGGEDIAERIRSASGLEAGSPIRSRRVHTASHSTTTAIYKSKITMKIVVFVGLITLVRPSLDLGHQM
jgi:hypothetical protein